MDFAYITISLKDYGPENNRSYRYVLAVIDEIPRFRWTHPLNSKKDETKKEVFENIFISSKGFPSLIETDCGREFLNRVFTHCLKETTWKDIVVKLL